MTFYSISGLVQKLVVICLLDQTNRIDQTSAETNAAALLDLLSSMSSEVLLDLQDLAQDLVQDLAQTPVSLSAEGLDELTLTLHELLCPKTNRALRHRPSSCRLLTRAFVLAAVDPGGGGLRSA